jgi:hypothetical protein
LIHFTPFRTPRLTIQLRELTIGQSIALCARPPHLFEASVTAMLEAVIEPSERHHAGQVRDPRLMTVHERGALAAHYLAHSSGKPNFAIGDTATFSQYLLHEVQTASEIEVGEIAEDRWYLSPLLGYQAESIERLISSGRLMQGRQGWLMGALACQMRREQEPELQDIADALFDEWLDDRLQTLQRFPESIFAELMGAYLLANQNLQHLLRMAFSDEGIVFVSEVPGLPSARFPVSDMLSDGTAAFLGLTTGLGDRADAMESAAG